MNLLIFTQPKIVKKEKLISPELGKSPEFTHSITSLLVFGTYEKPYREIGLIYKIYHKNKYKNS